METLSFFPGVPQMWSGGHPPLDIPMNLPNKCKINSIILLIIINVRCIQWLYVKIKSLLNMDRIFKNKTKCYVTTRNPSILLSKSRFICEIVSSSMSDNRHWREH